MAFTERFTGRAASYVSGRPSYPPEAIAALFEGLGEPANLRVADIGAGTGISARLLGEYGARVFAVEPNAAMRAAAAPSEQVEWVDGTAEATGLATGSVDLSVAMQAWHWFDHDRALAEQRRIVRPGGRIALVYNERDDRAPFTAAYSAIVRRYATENTEERRARALAAFAAISGAERLEFGNEQVLDRAGLGARAASTSYLPHDGTAAAELTADIDKVFGAYADASGLVRFNLVTIVARVSS
jgi:SAM-dependent methyltransferase